MVNSFGIAAWHAYATGWPLLSSCPYVFCALCRSPSCFALLQLQGAQQYEASTPSAAEEARRLFIAGSDGGDGGTVGGSSSGGSGSGSGAGSGGSSSSLDAEQQAAASRLLLHSREHSQHRTKQYHTDDALEQRMHHLLQLGFSERAMRAAIKRDGGGPYVAEATLGAAVRVLRAAGFNQKQLDGLLVESSVFTRSPADIADTLAWLLQQFGLTEQQLPLACARSPTLLHYKLETLQHNWSEVEETYDPTPAAMNKLATALRQGKAKFLLLPPKTVRCASCMEAEPSSMIYPWHDH